MTIRQFAAENGVNRQTVYNWLQASGRPVDSLKDNTTGQLTEQGMSLLQAKLTVKSKSKKQTVRQTVKQTREQTQLADSRLAAVEHDRDAYKQACQVLQAKVEGLTAQVEDLRDAVSREHSMVEFLQNQLTAITTPKLSGQTAKSTGESLTAKQRIKAFFTGKV